MRFVHVIPLASFCLVELLIELWPNLSKRLRSLTDVDNLADEAVQLVRKAQTSKFINGVLKTIELTNLSTEAVNY